MLGAISGDVIGSVHEGARTKTKDFPLFVSDSTFTDDTVLTIAVAESLLRPRDYVDAFHGYFEAYPLVGYGPMFFQWCYANGREPYNSWGNGSLCASALLRMPRIHSKKFWRRRSEVRK